MADQENRRRRNAEFLRDINRDDQILEINESINSQSSLEEFSDYYKSAKRKQAVQKLILSSTSIPQMIEIGQVHHLAPVVPNIIKNENNRHMQVIKKILQSFAIYEEKMKISKDRMSANAKEGMKLMKAGLEKIQEGMQEVNNMIIQHKESSDYFSNVAKELSEI